jgi:hypothetical protein
VNNPLRQQTIDVIIPQAAEAGIEISARPDPDIFSDATVPTSLEAGGFDIALAGSRGRSRSGRGDLYRIDALLWEDLITTIGGRRRR